MTVGRRMRGRTALVTGAAGGIGAAVCARLADEGATVACLDIDAAGAGRVADDVGNGAFPLVADVTDEDQVRWAIELTTGQAHLDVLVNVVGRNGPVADAEGTALPDWEHTQAVNLRGMFLTAKYALPHLVRSRGVVVNMSSALAFVGWPADCAYGPTKAGVVALTRGLAVDYAPHVRVNCVCPGAVRTAMTEELLEPGRDLEAALAEYGAIHPLHRRLAWPREIADAVLFLASADASYLTGVALPVDGGFLAGDRL